MFTRLDGARLARIDRQLLFQIIRRHLPVLTHNRPFLRSTRLRARRPRVPSPGELFARWPSRCRRVTTMPSRESSPTIRVSATSDWIRREAINIPTADRQVIGRSGFLDICRRQVDGDMATGHASAAIANRRPHTLSAFLHRRRRAIPNNHDAGNSSPLTNTSTSTSTPSRTDDCGTIDFGEHPVEPLTTIPLAANQAPPSTIVMNASASTCRPIW